MKDRQCVDTYLRFVIAIQGVEMRRVVVIVIHANDNAVKTTNLRHG